MWSAVEKLERQIDAETQPKLVGRNEEDYLIRGEPNQLFRWSLTLVVAIAHVIRIFYFDRGYFLLTLVFGLLYLEQLYDYLFVHTTNVLKASDWSKFQHKTADGQDLHLEPRISFYFRDKMSPQEFDTLVLRILEFKFWFYTMKTVLLAFLLTWYTLLRCSFFGPEYLLVWIGMHGGRYVRAGMARKSAPIASVEA